MYKKMLELMLNGVPVEGKENRPFDIIDYFSLTQESYEEFYEKAKNITLSAKDKENKLIVRTVIQPPSYVTFNKDLKNEK